MKKNRIAISGTLLAIGLTLAASASAQTGLTATPSPKNLSAQGGGLSSGWVTITNHGPGFASHLAVSKSNDLGPHHGALSILSDTCSGATLAQNGTCTVQLQYEAPCYVRAGYQDTWFMQFTSTEFPALNLNVVGTNLTNGCL